MVVRKGEEWGTHGSPDPRLPIAGSDREASQMLARGLVQFVLSEGDMARTVGALPVTPSCSFRRLPMDVLELRLHRPGRPPERVLALNSCIIRQPWTKGGYLRGEVAVLCNAQFVGRRDVAPRGHPNDGKFELLTFAGHLTARQRMHILRRMKSGDHLPHPSISYRQVARLDDVELEGDAIIDGAVFRGVRVVSAACVPDALEVWVACP